MTVATLTTERGGVTSLWAGTRPTEGIGLAWLGQAGFALRFGRRRVLIDPYLSDYLAQKYHGAEFPHRRLMPAPIEVAKVRRVRWVLCTHAHSDHMDPITLSLIATTTPECRFVVPAAEAGTAESRGLPADRLLAVDAGESHDLGEGLELMVLSAAHEELRRDRHGRHHYLGYVLLFEGVAVYHSGDTVPFDGLVDAVREARPDLALLPVNGRDEHRRSQGVAGNLTVPEAVELCLQTETPWLVPHHFGMFDFNTADPYELKAAARRHAEPPLRIEIPQTQRHYFLR